MAKAQRYKATLRSLTLSGWKSIRRIDPPLAFGRINLLIGPNGAGKSNLVSFFKMLNEMTGARLQEFIGRSGGAESLLYLGSKETPQIEATLEFDSKDGPNRYYLRLVHAAGDTLIFAEERLDFQRSGKTIWKTKALGAGHRETLLEQAVEDERLHARGTTNVGFMATVTRCLLTHCRVFHFHDTSDTARVRQSCYIEQNRHLAPDAANLAAVLYRFKIKEPLAYRRIVETIRLILPAFDDFVLEPQKLNPRNILLDWRARGTNYEFGPHQLSDGSLRAMALTTLLLQPKEELPDVIILDEPELGLHPYALNLLAALLKSASVHCQLLVATQSVMLLDEFEPKDVIVLDREGHESILSRPDPDKLKDWLPEYTLGEVWGKNVIGGGPFRDPRVGEDLKIIRAKVKNPEEINDSSETHSSKRIEQRCPEFQKTFHGVLAAERIGIETMRAECPHFREWLMALENLSHAT